MAAEDTACQAWDSLAPKIMDTLSQSSLLWQGLSLVCIGSASSADATPTVLIEAADIIDPRWELMKDALLKASEDSPCDLQVWQIWIKLSVRGRRRIGTRSIQAPGFAPENFLLRPNVVVELMEVIGPGDLNETREAFSFPTRRVSLPHHILANDSSAT